MSDYEELSSLIPKIVDAAIDSDMINHGWDLKGPKYWMNFSLNVAVYFDGHYEWTGGGLGPSSDPMKTPGQWLPWEAWEKWRTDIPAAFAGWDALPETTVCDAALADNAKVRSMIGLDPDTSEASLNPQGVQLAKDVQVLQDTIGKYSGATMTEFIRNVIAPMRSTIPQQYAVACLLGLILRAEKEVWIRSRKSVASIADAALEAMEKANRQEGGSELPAWLELVGAVAGAASMFFTEGATAPLVLEGIERTVLVLGGLEAAGGEQEKVKNELSASDPDGVYGKLTKALSDLNDQMVKEENKLTSATTGATSTIRGNLSTYDLSQPTKLFGAHSPQDVLDPSTIHVDVVRLQSLAKGEMHSVAAELKAAVGSVEASYTFTPFDRPSNLGANPCYGYGELCWELEQLLTDSAWTVQESANVLWDAAADFSQTDDRASTRLDQDRSDIAKGSGAYPIPNPHPTEHGGR